MAVKPGIIDLHETSPGSWGMPLRIRGAAQRRKPIPDDTPIGPGKPILNGWEVANISTAWFVAIVWGVLPIIAGLLQLLFR